MGRLERSSRAVDTCETCRYIGEHGGLPPRAPAHCRDCHRNWRGLAQAHCAVCCRHFSTDGAADEHKRTGSDGELSCVDPELLRRRSGEPVLVLDHDRYGPIWRWAGSDRRFSKASG